MRRSVPRHCGAPPQWSYLPFEYRMGTGPITKSYGDRPHSLGGGVKSLVYYFDEVALFASKTDGLAFVRER